MTTAAHAEALHGARLLRMVVVGPDMREGFAALHTLAAELRNVATPIAAMLDELELLAGSTSSLTDAERDARAGVERLRALADALIGTTDEPPITQRSAR